MILFLIENLKFPEELSQIYPEDINDYTDEEIRQEIKKLEKKYGPDDADPYEPGISGKMLTKSIERNKEIDLIISFLKDELEKREG